MRRNEAGFTLIEVLIAFAIAALSLAAFMQVFSTGARNAVTAKDYARATMHAESLLAQVGVEEPLAPGAKAGRFSDGQRWRVVVRPYVAGDETAIAEIFDVEVAVSWGEEGGSERTVSLRSLRLAAVKR